MFCRRWHTMSLLIYPFTFKRTRDVQNLRYIGIKFLALSSLEQTNSLTSKYPIPKLKRCFSSISQAIHGTLQPHYFDKMGPYIVFWFTSWPDRANILSSTGLLCSKSCWAWMIKDKNDPTLSEKCDIQVTPQTLLESFKSQGIAHTQLGYFCMCTVFRSTLLLNREQILIATALVGQNYSANQRQGTMAPSLPPPKHLIWNTKFKMLCLLFAQH